MAQQPTPAAGSGLVITVESATQAFDIWETRYRESPSDFLTADEVARMEVATVAERSAIYFLALLREPVQGGAA